MRVVVADDDPAINRLLQTYVSAYVPDAEIHCAANADQALTYLRAAPTDLLLLDLAMPGMSGVELCMFLSSTHLLQDCMVVAISALAAPDDVDLLRRLGVTRFVSKGADLLRHVADYAMKQREIVQCRLLPARAGNPEG